MKEDRDETNKIYQKRVMMLSSGQFDTDQIDPFYQEKFEFAIDHKFSSDEESIEESIDDYLVEDITIMVWDFINIAMNSFKFPKEVPEEMPENTVFLQQRDEAINAIQYCFLEIK